jgi:hypothetical protein
MDLVVLNAGDFQNSENGGTYVLLGNAKGGFTMSDDLTDVPNPYDAAIVLTPVNSSYDCTGSYGEVPILGTGPLATLHPADGAVCHAALAAGGVSILLRGRATPIFSSQTRNRWLFALSLRFDNPIFVDQNLQETVGHS